MRVALVALLVGMLALAVSGPAAAEGPDAIVNDPGCRVNQLSRNDDGSTGAVPIGFPVNFFGTTNTHLFVNNNGNVTFDSSLGTFTPFGLSGPTGRRIIAPFFGDVDTRGAGSDIVRYSFGPVTFNGRPAFCVDWVNVGFFSGRFHRLNSFQLLIVDRSDVGVGDFDIVFNYDKIQWETGQASGGNSDGLGGTSAAVGFSAGTGVAGTFFQLPGSFVNGALLDTNGVTGLIHNSRNTLQLGRYIFPVRNGAAPAGGSIRGTVFGPGGTTLEGALVQVCPAAGGQCTFVTATNSLGQYHASGLPPNDYTVTAYPPAGSSVAPNSEGPLNVVVGSDLVQDIVLTGPTPPPAGTSIDNDTPPGAIPSVVVGQPVHLVTTGCDGGDATYTVTGVYGGSISGAMVEGPPGTYTADFAIPFTGPAHVTIVIDGCPTIEFDIYIDPSGFVLTPGGNAIEGATVTLFRADSPSGPFVQVPDGSAIMSPANRSNPDLTDATGHFGWDTIAGYYKVRAEKADCHAPGNPAQPFVETPVLPVPPPVTDIDLRLEGPGCAGDVLPPVITVPADITAEATGPDGAIVSYAVSAEDNVDGPVDVSCAPASGSLFSLGSTTVTCTAEDAAGNAAEAMFSVNVVDTTPPTITCPPPVVAEATSPAGAEVNAGGATADDLVGPVTVTAPATGTFPLGTTLVTYVATDGAGNTASCTTSVTVQDTTAPVLAVPSGLTVDATSPAGAVVTFTASASDIVDGTFTPTCSPASGGTFAIGTTTVTCSAEDAAGNGADAEFDVTVRGAAEQIADLIAASTGVGPGSSLADKAREAQASLAAGEVEDACGVLNAYLNELRAQTGKKVTAAQAADLKARVDQIRAVLDC